MDTNSSLCTHTSRCASETQPVPPPVKALNVTPGWEGTIAGAESEAQRLAVLGAFKDLRLGEHFAAFL